MSKKQGILIVGGGWVSIQHINAFKNNPGAEILAICGRTKEGASKCAAGAGLDVQYFDDYQEALKLPGVDIVAIGSPQHVHADQAIAAAQAGKHMLIEKPVAQTPAEMYAMRDAVRLAGVKTVVSFVLRWNPLFQRLKKTFRKTKQSPHLN